MREITGHKTNAVNDELTLHAVDEPGPGGANHAYDIGGLFGNVTLRIGFQNGPIKEYGVNGITQEVLLAIVIDRLRSFQAGPYACAANVVALEDCQSALGALKARTMERQARGVEGTHQV